jgi:hypothetical protein
LLWGFKRSCGRAAIILRLYPALGGSRRVEHQIWALNIKFWDERDSSPFVTLDPKTPYTTCQNLDEGQVGL